jgi:hypothetical protein
MPQQTGNIVQCLQIEQFCVIVINSYYPTVAASVAGAGAASFWWCKIRSLSVMLRVQQLCSGQINFKEENGVA